MTSPAWALLASTLVAITLLVESAGTAWATGPSVLVVEAMCNPGLPATALTDQIRGQSGAPVGVFDGRTGTVSLAQLRSYDVAVAMGDCGWLDPAATGNRLADFQDEGGVVIGAGFDWRGAAGSALAGRWISGGYSPFETGSTPASGYVTVGRQEAGNPLLAGIPAFQDDEGGGPLFAGYRDAVQMGPGADEIAQWADGTPAIAVRGRAVGVNAYIGDHYPYAWSGGFGTLVVNAGEVLGRHSYPAPVRRCKKHKRLNPKTGRCVKNKRKKR